MNTESRLSNYFTVISLRLKDFAWSFVLGLIIVFVLVLPTLLVTYNLLGLESILKTEIGSQVRNFFEGIDSISMTNSVVTFLFWGGIGLIVYALVSSFVRGTQRLGEELEASIQEYISAKNIDKNAIQKSIIVNSLIRLGILTALVIVSGMVIMVLLPVATIHWRSFVLTPDLKDLTTALGGSIILSIGIAALFMLVRAWRYRRLIMR